MRKFMFAGTAVLMAHAAMAQGVTAELAGTGSDVSFLNMRATGNVCSVGMRRLALGVQGISVCQLFINQCMTKADGAIVENWRGEWACKP